MQIRDICSDIRANDGYLLLLLWILRWSINFWFLLNRLPNRDQSQTKFFSSEWMTDCLLRQYFLFVVNSHEIIGYSFECKNSCLLKMLAILKAAKHPINLNLNWRSIECVHKWDLSTDSRHPLVAQLNGRSFECLILWIIKLFFIFVLY